MAQKWTFTCRCGYTIDVSPPVSNEGGISITYHRMNGTCPECGLVWGNISVMGDDFALCHKCAEPILDKLRLVDHSLGVFYHGVCYQPPDKGVSP